MIITDEIKTAIQNYYEMPGSITQINESQENLTEYTEIIYLLNDREEKIVCAGSVNSILQQINK